MDETERQNSLARMRREMERERQRRAEHDVRPAHELNRAASPVDRSAFNPHNRLSETPPPPQVPGHSSGLPPAHDPFAGPAPDLSQNHSPEPIYAPDAAAPAPTPVPESSLSAAAQPYLPPEVSPDPVADLAPAPTQPDNAWQFAEQDYGAPEPAPETLQQELPPQGYSPVEEPPVSPGFEVSQAEPLYAEGIQAGGGAGENPEMSAQLDIERGVGLRPAPAPRPRKIQPATATDTANISDPNIPQAGHGDGGQPPVVPPASTGNGSGGGSSPPIAARLRSKSPWVRRLALTGGGIVALLLLLIFVLPLLLPTGTITREVERQVQSATGWDLAIDGPVSIGVLPSPRLRLNDVTVSSGEAGGNARLVEIDTLRFGINFAAIFTGNVRLSEVALVGPSITLSVDEAGRSSWAMDAGPGSGAAASGAADQVSNTGDALAALERLQIDEVSIRDGRFSYSDLGSLASYSVEEINLTSALSSLDAPLQVEGSFAYEGQSFELTTRLDKPRAAISNAQSPVELRLTGVPFNGEITGNLDFGLGPAFGGLAAINVPSIPALAAWLGATLPNDTKSLESLQTTAEISANPSIVDVSNFALTIGEESVQGSVRADLSQEVPTIGGRVFSEAIDVPALAAAFGLSGEGQPQLGGSLIIDLQFATLGESVDEMAASLNARGSLGLRSGTISNLGLGVALGDAAADQVNNINANITINTLDTPIGLLGQADWRGERFDISGQFGAGQMLANGMGPAQLGINSTRISGGIDGTLSQTGDFDGNVTLETRSLRALLAWMNMPLGDGGTSQQAFGPFSYSGALSLSPGAVNFSNARFALDNSLGSGSGALLYSGKPTLNANLAMQVLDLTPYAAGGGQSGASGGSTSALPGIDSGSAQNGGWSTAPIDFSALSGMNAQLSLSASQIIYDQIRTGQTSMAVSLEDGVLTADLNEMQLYDGRGAGRVQLDASAPTPSLSVNFDLASLNALPFLNDAIGLNRIQGLGDLSLSLRANGSSALALVQSLDGESRMIFRDGALRGINIPQMVRTLSARTLVGWQTNEAQQTDFSEFSAAFEIVNGLARTRDQNIRFVGPLVRATGAGTVDLPAKTLEMRFDPRIVASLQGQNGTSGDLRGLGVPIVVAGSWNNPRIYPDIAGILQNPDAAFRQLQQFGGGLASLTDDGDALRDQVRERTGIDLNSVVQDGRINRDAALNQGADLIGRLVGGQAAGGLGQNVGNNVGLGGTAQPNAGGPPIPRPDPRGSLVRPTAPSNAAPRFMTPAEVRRVTGGRAVVSGTGGSAAPTAPASPPAAAPPPSDGGPIDLLNPGGGGSQPVAPGSGNPRGPLRNPIEGVLRGIFGR